MDGGGDGKERGLMSGCVFRYGAGEIGTQKPGKKTEAVIAVMEEEAEAEAEAK